MYHTHELDPQLRIKGKYRTITGNYKGRNYRICNVNGLSFNYYRGTYTEKYIQSNKDVDLIYFRNYIPNSFQNTSKKIDQWNRKFCIPYTESTFDVGGGLTHGKCIPSGFFNHNLIIKGKHEVEIVNYSVKDKLRNGETTYYVPCISYADMGGYSECIIDFYIRVPIKRRLDDFNKAMSSYFRKTKIDLKKKESFTGLPFLGVEYHYPHFDRELQIMFYDRLDVIYEDTKELIASL